MNYLGNAFSLQMLVDTMATVSIEPIQKKEIPSDCLSVIGHQDLADYMNVPMTRISIKLESDDALYVVQFMGGRLPEGLTMLRADQIGMLQYFRVTVQYPAISYNTEDMLENPENYGLV